MINNHATQPFTVRLLPLPLLTALALPGQLQTAHAAVTIIGDVDPADPAGWNDSTDAYIGKTTTGSVAVDSDSHLLSLESYIGYESGAMGTVAVDGAGSTWDNDGHLYIGYSGNGTLNVTAGAAVSSGHARIGYNSWSTGTVTVDGAGSTWDIDGSLYVCHSGPGTLNVTGGGAVSTSGVGYIGYWGTVTVDGSGSMWSNLIIEVGTSRNGGLNISGGGAATATRVEIYDPSRLVVDVGNRSRLTVDNGSGEIDNGGLVRVVAGTGVAAGGVYTPIAAGTWTGSGRYEAIGGTWDDGTHEFTASAVLAGTSGDEMTIDLADVQRVLISDGESDWAVGASFATSDVSKQITFTALAVAGDSLADLERILDADQTVLSAWEFTAGGAYAADDPACLSFDVGEGFSRGDLSVWHLDGADWAAYSPADLTYNGTYASFTVDGFSSYAVTAVPEPGTLAMLLTLAAMALLWRARHVPVKTSPTRQRKPGTTSCPSSSSFSVSVLMSVAER